MKVLIRDADTGRYWGSSGWVQNPDAAAIFGSLDAAGQKAKACEPADVNVVLRYEQPECELALNPVYCIQTSLAPPSLRAAA